MDVLADLLGGNQRVKVMRLFLGNPELALAAPEVAKRCRIASPASSREVRFLGKIGFLTRRRHGRKPVWQLNSAFPLLSPLRHLLKNNLAGRKKELIRLFSRCGRLTLLVIAGVFIENPDSRADLLIVGDGLRKNSVTRAVAGLEAEIGQELNYAMMETPEFNYRLTACDKFIRDILDYPHDVLIDKVGLS